MPTQVLVAPDKFKGSLTAVEVTAALADGLAGRGIAVTPLPLADGGDGSVAAAVAAGYRRHAVTVPDALGRRHEADIAVSGTSAVVEVANTCGLSLLARTDREAARTASSQGLGVAVREALRLGALDIVLALGGSASTDGGSGLLTALGARLLDADGAPLPPGGTALRRLARLDLRYLIDLNGVRLVVASDVTAPLLGRDGAAAVFGPQKGAAPQDIRDLEQGLSCLAGALAATGSHVAADAAGAGAAGGVGFAAAFLGGHLRSGADHFLDLLGFGAAVAGAAAVVTGEGALDRQTLMGKLPAAVARRAGGRPVHLAVGRNVLDDVPHPFTSIRAAADLADSDTSADPDLTARTLTRIGAKIADDVLAGVDERLGCSGASSATLRQSSRRRERQALPRDAPSRASPFHVSPRGRNSR